MKPLLESIRRDTAVFHAVKARRLVLIRHALETGEAVVAIAEAAGTSKHRMSQIRDELGIPPRQAGRPRKEVGSEG